MTEAFLASLWKMLAAVVAVGFPNPSAWWRSEFERFARADCRRWIIRAGRRGGKSYFVCLLGVAWGWFGAWSVPPGDVAVVAIVSVSKDEASARLRTIGELLRALGIKFATRGDELEADFGNGRRVVYRAIACTTTATVGFTSILVLGDEVARWESRDTAANPAREVFGSLMPTLATQEHGFAVMCSSPWSSDDFHAECFDAGDTDHQIVSFAPTWIANPTISEARTHELEPDPRVWSREYAATPGETVSAALDALDVEGAFSQTIEGYEGSAFVAIDASSLRGDAFAWIAGHETTDGRIAVREIGGWEGEQQRLVSMDEIVGAISMKCLHLGTRIVYGDQREEAALRSLFAQRGVALRSFAWSEPSKDAAVMTLRRMMRERRIGIAPHETMRRELVGMKARLMPSGRVRYESNGLDFASALITLMHAIDAGLVLTGRGGAAPAPQTIAGGWTDWGNEGFL
jgi:hypothetical protein